jgi:hypothetical protein
MEYTYDFNKDINYIDYSESDIDSSISSDLDDLSDNSSDSSDEYSNKDYYNSENLSKTQIIEKINDIKRMFNLPSNKNEKYCPHMENDYKIKCLKCDKIYFCSKCHDEESDHKLEYKDSYIICCYCNIEQNYTDYCIGCDYILKVKYACKKCVIFDNSGKYKYHCNNCDKCHTEEKSELKECNKCKICYLKKKKHTCFNKDDDCPICLDKLGNNTIVNMKCGHIIHNKCYSELIKNTYKCPLCSKTILDMSDEFERIDKKIENESNIFEKVIDLKSIYCNDCEIKTEANYNYLGIKCPNCGSYNTRMQ